MQPISTDQFLSSCKAGDLLKVNEFIDAGGNVNIEGNENTTALMQASHAGHDKVVKRLIEAKANVKHVNKDNKHTAFTYAFNEILHLEEGPKIKIKMKANVLTCTKLLAENGALYNLNDEPMILDLKEELLEKYLSSFNLLYRFSFIMPKISRIYPYFDIQLKQFHLLKLLNPKVEIPNELQKAMTDNKTAIDEVNKIKSFIILNNINRYINSLSEDDKGVLSIITEEKYNNLSNDNDEIKENFTDFITAGFIGFPIFEGKLTTALSQETIKKMLMNYYAKSTHNAIISNGLYKFGYNDELLKKIMTTLKEKKQTFEEGFVEKYRRIREKCNREILDLNNLGVLSALKPYLLNLLSNYYEKSSEAFSKIENLLTGASEDSHPEVINFLKLPINAENKPVKPTILAAANYGHISIVKKLIEAKANVNSKDENGATALMEASKEGRVEVIEYLLQHNADVNICDSNKMSAVDYATSPKIKEILLRSTKDFEPVAVEEKKSSSSPSV